MYFKYAQKNRLMNKSKKPTLHENEDFSLNLPFIVFV